MAEPMSSNEIEDVLSSIRRLVAQDLKPADRAKLAAVADATQKLVLAPEQRIEDARVEVEHVQEDHVQEDRAKFATVRRPSRRAAFPPVDAVLAGVAALAGRGQRDDAGASGGWALGATQTFGDQPAHDPIPDYVAVVETQTIEAAPQRADWPPAGTNYAQPADTDQIIALPPGYGQDDVPGGGDFAVDPNARLFDMASTAFSGETFADDTAPDWKNTDWQDVEPDDAAPEESVDPAQDAAAQTPFQESQSLQGTIEPDSDWADAAEARVIAELAGVAVADEVFEQAQGNFREPKFTASAPQAAPEVLFDEDVLRAMVQAIFREEMAGPMGERITRNIRKLVRAEVGRMLAAHELE